MLLLALFLLALMLRGLGAVDYGRDWYGPGSFTQINFDEGGSCRAALNAFPYTPFVGQQTIALTKLTGQEVPANSVGDHRAVKSFCHSPGHLGVARLYSAATGALTVVALYVLTLLLFPGERALALTASALLALSGWHISESMVATVDAPSTFFIYSFLAATLWAHRRGGGRWLLAVILLLPAVWTKYWLFAVFALSILLPPSVYLRVVAGVSWQRWCGMALAYGLLFAVATNPALAAPLPWVVPVLFYVTVPWKSLTRPALALLLLAPWLAPLALQFEPFVAYSSGSLTGRFGTDYGAIGWHKFLRNGLNLPIVALIGLSLPGFILLLLAGTRFFRSPPTSRAWLVLLPLAVFALYMVFLAPVTYYRHYLPLLPVLCLFAAYGLMGLRERFRLPVLALVLLWQTALAWDLVSDYHFDPRRELPRWYAEHKPQRVLSSYYVNPPGTSGVRHRLFRVRDLVPVPAYGLRGDTLILSENWYDTAFANELNGPLVHDARRLIKTTPEAVAFYRRVLAGEDPWLEPVARLRAPTFMPELLLHRATYGSFTQFVGDLVILRIRSDVPGAGL